MKGKTVKATLRHFRMSPQRVREIADIIRGKGAEDARNILEFTGRKAAVMMKKLLDSALANAENNHNMDPDALFIKTVFVDEGPSWKRFIPRAQGRAARILKRTSHITIELDEIED